MPRDDHRLRIVVRPEAAQVDQWRSYEDRKRVIAETACSASEYERRLFELAREMSL